MKSDRPALPPFSPPPTVLRAALAVRRGVGRAHDALGLPVVRVFEQTVALAEVHATTAMVRLGLPEAMQSGPRSSANLAGIVGADPDHLDRLLRFLATRGIVARKGTTWTLTSAGDLLRADHPDSVRDWVLFLGSDWQLDAWKHLADGVRDPTRTPFEVEHDRTFFEHATTQPEAGRRFDDAMRSTSRLQGQLAARAIDLAGVEHVCDVGGGTGSLLAQLLHANPTVRGSIVDLPEVIQRARPVLAAEGLADRIDLVPGDMFAQVPNGADRYVLSAIIHDWADDEAVQILRNVRDAMSPAARTIVIELELPDHDGAALERAYDLLMMVLGGGRERTRSDFEQLYARAGLHLDRDVVMGNGWHAHHLRRDGQA